MFKLNNETRYSCVLIGLVIGLSASAMAQKQLPDNPLGKPHQVTTMGGPVMGVPVDVDLTRVPTLRPWRPGDPIREIPRRDSGDGRPVSDGPARLDPLVETQWFFESSTRMPGVVEIENFEGNHSTANPNDPSGEVGRDHFIEAINGPGGTSVTIYSKANGSLQAGPFALDTLATGGQCRRGLGDPVVMYDHLADRWFLSEFSRSGNRLCVYTSRTNDPINGGWCFYEFADSSFPDYPKYGVWPDFYMASSNQGDTPPVYAFDRANMLSADGVSCPTARATQKITGAPGLPGLGFETLAPVDLDGPPPPAGSPAYFIRHRDEEFHGDANASPSQDRLELWTLAVDFNNAGNTVLNQLPDVMIADFDSNLCPPVSVFACIPQPNGGAALDPLLEVVMNAVTYRNFGSHETILGVLQTDVGDFNDHSGERWFELRNAGSGWQLFQEGTWSPDADGRFMGMVDMDSAGNILLAYNVSSTSVFPSLRYTGRESTDPAGVMSLGETVFAQGNAINSSSRYGDYNHMSVDPVDDCTFWFLGMYNPNTGSDTKGVRIGAVKFDSCSGGSGGNNPPTAAFSFNCVDLACTFDGSASSDSDGGIVSYSWNFGDGASASGVTSSHTYAGAGAFSVTLTVTDDGGANGSASQVVTVTQAGGNDITLSATPLNRGRVNLSWNGATGNRVDVYRDGSVIKTTNNDGDYTDRPGNGTFTYQVCEENSTTACSNEETVTL